MEVINTIYQRQRKGINATFGFMVVLAFWVFADWQVGSELFFVGPWRVFTYTFELFATGKILNDLKVSGIEFFWGYGIAAVVGISLGMLFGISRGFREFFDPWLSALYATPSVALAPLIVIWFGVELGAKIVIVLITAVIPIILNTYTGVMSVGKEFQTLASSFCIPKNQVIYKILIPGSLPFIITGLRLGVSRGIVGVVVGEYFGSSEGLGYQLFAGLDTFNMPLMMSCAFLLAGTGVLFNDLILIVAKRMAPWRDTQIQE
jgi:ABC-type nitrate/sulfonate/bicarbonate transport system permease component